MPKEKKTRKQTAAMAAAPFCFCMQSQTSVRAYGYHDVEMNAGSLDGVHMKRALEHRLP